MIESLKNIGVLLGVIAFAWKVWDAYVSYLHIYLEKPELEGGNITIRTRIENRGLVRKTVNYAILLVGPEAENPIETAQAISTCLGDQVKIQCTNDIEHLKADNPVITDQGRALIPLSFFYSEQVAIGDEDLSYRCHLSIQTFETNTPYSVRFFVFAQKRLHRSTQESFIIEAKDNQ
ncbi:MAG: hypothetical protein CEE38_03610 [Planctomycetes bacterium B3_Pla]|nr:MAG: hypothetical protein CEE38_03610 [Planctomycetes bacterium B3_Pla]